MEEEDSQVDSSVEEHCIEDECKQVGRRGVSNEVKNYNLSLEEDSHPIIPGQLFAVAPSLLSPPPPPPPPLSLSLTPSLPPSLSNSPPLVLLHV